MLHNSVVLQTQIWELMKTVLVLVFAASLVACAGKVDYVRPTPPVGKTNAKVVDRPREDVWNSSVPQLGKQFFVINNLDKSSGLINVSYNGDPELYVDCGQVTSYVKNARGERTYQFPGARAQTAYEVMAPNGLFTFQRKMNLEGRVNLIFEDAGSGTTRITANTRYVVTRQSTVQAAAGGYPQTTTDNISFNSGGSASFPGSGENQGTECVSTGRLEEEILSAVR